MNPPPPDPRGALSLSSPAAVDPQPALPTAGGPEEQQAALLASVLPLIPQVEPAGTSDHIFVLDISGKCGAATTADIIANGIAAPPAH